MLNKRHSDCNWLYCDLTLCCIMQLVTCSLASTWSRVAESSALTRACSSSMVSCFKQAHTLYISTSTRICFLCVITGTANKLERTDVNFEAWPSSLAARHTQVWIQTQTSCIVFVVDFLPSNLLRVRQHSEVPSTKTQGGNIKLKNK